MHTNDDNHNHSGDSGESDAPHNNNEEDSQNDEQVGCVDHGGEACVGYDTLCHRMVCAQCVGVAPFAPRLQARRNAVCSGMPDHMLSMPVVDHGFPNPNPSPRNRVAGSTTSTRRTTRRVEGDHMGHPVMMRSSFLSSSLWCEQMKELLGGQIRGLEQEARHGITALASRQEAINQSMKRWTLIQSQACNHITAFFDQVRQMLDERQQETIGEVNKAVKDKLFELHDQQQCISNVLACAQHCVETVIPKTTNTSSIQTMINTRDAVRGATIQINQIITQQPHDIPQQQRRGGQDGTREEAGVVRGYEYLREWDSGAVRVEVNNDAINRIREMINDPQLTRVVCDEDEFKAAIISQPPIQDDEDSSGGEEEPGHALEAQREIMAVIRQVNRGERSTQDGAKQIRSVLKHNASLKHLQLCTWANQIGDAGTTALAHALQTNNTLTRFDLYVNQIGAAGATALAHALQTNNTLTELRLWKNQIGDAGATALAHALKTNNTCKVLHLIENQIGDAGATVLAHALQTTNALKELNLIANRIRDAGATALAHALQTNDALTELWLWGNQIAEAGATALAHALQTNSTLSGLGLDANQIGDAGATALAHALQTNSTLIDLRLLGNRIGDAGATALAHALQTNSRLSRLGLNANQVGDAGASALAHALQTNRTLTGLHLNENQIGDAGATALAHALKTNNTCKVLHLIGNRVGDNGAKALIKMLNTNKSLKELDFIDGYDKAMNISQRTRKRLETALSDR